MKILEITVLCLFLWVSSFAQNKIAVVDTSVFYDDKSGIKRLTETVKLTYDCDFQSLSFIKKISEIKNEIEILKTQSKSTDEKKLELSKIEEEYNSYQKRRDESYKKRYSILIEPIEKQIKNKLKLFSAVKGYTIIFDAAADNSGLICYFDNITDVTKEFIKYCNEEFEKEKAQKQ